MKIIGYIVQKEFRQIFRNKGMLPIIFIMPLVQLLILSNAATFDVKNIAFSYIDHDKSPASRALLEKFKASSYFDVQESFPSAKTAQAAMKKGKADVILEIPPYFERDLVKDKRTGLGLYINAIDGAKAGIENVYVQQIVKDYNHGIMAELVQVGSESPEQADVMMIPSFWYNNTLNYKTFMVPGILVLLVTMLSLFLSGMNIVREKEIGTLEQINVTPIKKKIPVHYR
jgi:ABC-2 type transport system permease protein